MKHEVLRPEPVSTEAEEHAPEAAGNEPGNQPDNHPDNEPDGIPENVRRVLDGATEALPAPMAAPTNAFGSLGIGRVLQIREHDVDVQIGGTIVLARCHPTLHHSVLKTASQTGEPVLVERGSDGSVMVMGALRTQPTAGIDEIEDLTIEADRIHLRGKKELLLTTSGVASIALRAAGEIETYADRIVSRAEELHKIVGRMLRLN